MGRHAFSIALPLPFSHHRVRLRYLCLVPYRFIGCSALTLRYASDLQHTSPHGHDNAVPFFGVKSTSHGANVVSISRKDNDKLDSTPSSSSPPQRPATSGVAPNCESPASQSADVIISRGQTGQWRSVIDKHRRQIGKRAERQLAMLGMKMNELTGYKEVERLKDVVHKRGMLVSLLLVTTLIPDVIRRA